VLDEYVERYRRQLWWAVARGSVIMLPAVTAAELPGGTLPFDLVLLILRQIDHETIRAIVTREFKQDLSHKVAKSRKKRS
jgi:hypothetical protein